ncbi:unnamed protein product [Dovyalis caffra]|uniref:Acyltransferase n=1 Tax=Dovyalis caffra TaxID=77055 RepID=A0AAV1RG59_9ROSI|nr:unnamed protein product [Dovyalis caffra]
MRMNSDLKDDISTSSLDSIYYSLLSNSLIFYSGFTLMLVNDCESIVFQVVFDYDDQMKIPFFRDLIKELTEEAVTLRAGLNCEVNQDMHFPVFLPKFPGRFYYYYGKPIETEGRMHELRDKDKAHKLYMQVKSEVEKCLAFLQEKRESDPYRNIVPRLAYQSTHGFDSEVPTFEI